MDPKGPIDAPPPILLLPRPGGDALDALGLPEASDNLFRRIIRDPLGRDRLVQERRCAEMLCAVLINCPSLSCHIVRWLAALTGCPGELVDELRWRFETEQLTIEGKRDDLRIEGFASEDETPAVLWTVEIKVGASFHESTPVFIDEDDEETAEPALVNQLMNYDAWLSPKDVQYKAGIVLAIPNLTASLPAGLSCRWHCTTWTGLGRTVQDAIEADGGPEAESTLARHMLGFIREHLWRDDQMPDPKLNFDHIALIRGMNQIGVECEKIVNDLVGSLVPILKASPLVSQEIKIQPWLYKQDNRCIVWSELTKTESEQKKTCVWLQAGIQHSSMAVWIEYPAKSKNSKIHQACETIKNKLAESSRRWELFSGSGPNLSTVRPLTTLLDADDQQAELHRFVKDALADLESADALRLFKEAVS